MSYQQGIEDAARLLREAANKLLEGKPNSVDWHTAYVLRAVEGRILRLAPGE